MSVKYLLGLPEPPDKGTLEELWAYVGDLYYALSRIAINTGAEIYEGEREPTNNDGKDGDIWIERA